MLFFTKFQEGRDVTSEEFGARNFLQDESAAMNLVNEALQ